MSVPAGPDLLRRVVSSVAADPINVDNIEIGLDILDQRLGPGFARAALAEAVQEGVRQGLLREPVRLPPGALQCHWHLEATAPARRGAGVSRPAP